jgi:hypothetical protein
VTSDEVRVGLKNCSVFSDRVVISPGSRDWSTCRFARSRLAVSARVKGSPVLSLFMFRFDLAFAMNWKLKVVKNERDILDFLCVNMCVARVSPIKSVDGRLAGWPGYGYSSDRMSSLVNQSRPALESIQHPVQRVLGAGSFSRNEAVESWSPYLVSSLRMLGALPPAPTHFSGIALMDKGIYPMYFSKGFFLRKCDAYART